MGKRAADVIVAKLETMMRDGSLPQGRPLPAERDLVTEFGASRTVIREAIAILAGHGWLECRPRHRPVVRKPDVTSVLGAVDGAVRNLLLGPGATGNLSDSRVFLERALVRDAALTATRESIAALEAALMANGAAIEDPAEFQATDVAFHGHFYRMTGNPVFMALHEGYTAWLEPHWRQVPRTPERNRLDHEAHSSIVDAIRARDPLGAEASLFRHLSESPEQGQEVIAP